jgi:hypothetical protein
MTVGEKTRSHRAVIVKVDFGGGCTVAYKV